MKKRRLIVAWSALCLLVGLALGYQANEDDWLGQMRQTWSKISSDQLTKPSQDQVTVEEPAPEPKSDQAKAASQAADQPYMEALGLAYDYANLSLEEVVKTYLDQIGASHNQVAFSYKNLVTGEQIAMNDTQPMTAGSTYKLPLNMLVVDEVAKGTYNLTDRFDITQTTYEYEGEHQAYVAQFGGSMSIPDMQEYSLVYSENTPAYALAERLGGMDKAYQLFDRYGQSKADLKTISHEGNQTTTDYYIQVLDYLWKNQEKYKDLLAFIGSSFPGQYYKTFWPDLTIYQKPGYVSNALNVDAIVMEETPYLIALYTAGLGGATEDAQDINQLGYVQLTELTYIINQWHRVNMNQPQ